MYLMEAITFGIDDDPVGGYWGHAGLWNSEFNGHSYIRIRELESGAVVQNISQAIGFAFPAAYVDYSRGRLWISATGYDRVNCARNRTYSKPGCTPLPGVSATNTHWGRGVYVFSSSDLVSWDGPYLTDVKWNGPNTAMAGVNRSGPSAPNLPDHAVVMATDDADTWAVHSGSDGNLSTGWKTLSPMQANGPMLDFGHPGGRCAAVRFFDPYYYIIGGGHVVHLGRSKDLLRWQMSGQCWQSLDKAHPVNCTGSGSSGGYSPDFIRPHPRDNLTATRVMRSAAQNHLRAGNGIGGGPSVPNRSLWDEDANDSDFCCDLPPEQGGPSESFVLWGCDSQGHYQAGPEGFACMGTANVTLQALLESYFEPPSAKE